MAWSKRLPTVKYSLWLEGETDEASELVMQLYWSLAESLRWRSVVAVSVSREFWSLSELCGSVVLRWWCWWWLLGEKDELFLGLLEQQQNERGLDLKQMRMTTRNVENKLNLGSKNWCHMTEEQMVTYTKPQPIPS